MLLVHREFFLLLLRLLLWLNSSIGSSWLLLLTLLQPTDSPLLLPLHSQSHHFLLHWRTISLLLNKVHSNLKLPLLTLTTNGVIPLLGPPLLPQSSLSDSSSEYTYSSASDSSIL
ncbi:unnamed protein product [Microthlaspi erraticum]|uniref:Uncharacterized protein n=1 Tax=Microthlaspi erraticum TaxID=1685480 RepID=A0A6D2HYI3_9BRAS|nr:unnamed protein product [Microthlaspi erraticum]